jgi:hypothetical protein
MITPTNPGWTRDHCTKNTEGIAKTAREYETLKTVAYPDKAGTYFLQSHIRVSLITWLQLNKGKISSGKHNFPTTFLMQSTILLLLLAKTTNDDTAPFMILWNTDKSAHHNTLPQSQY